MGDGRRPNPAQSGSAGDGDLPWNLAGTFPFGGPFTEGPLTAGAAAAPPAGAAATGAAGPAPAGADGLALAPGAALPGFGMPWAAGAGGTSPGIGTGTGAGLAPSEHPLNPLIATARADVATAHHKQRMCMGQDPQEG